MKKLLLILIVGFLVLSGLVGATESSNLMRTQSHLTIFNKVKQSLLLDELDQSQTVNDFPYPLGWYEGYYFGPHAQAFTPQKNILTRISLYGCIIGWPNPIQVAIRKDLNGEDLTTSKTYNSFLYCFSNRWVNFNFPDIPVIQGETYYIIMSTQNKHPTCYYLGGSKQNPYPSGISYLYYDGQWLERENYDFCFKSYGIGGPPNKPSTPSGNTNGNVNVEYTYTSSAIDPDGDQVYCWFNWGDGTNSGWIGPNNSGDTVSASHKWTTQGNYDIKVKFKDTYEAESVWSNPLSVTMPRNRAIDYTLFLRLLEQFPILHRLLSLIRV